MRSDKYKRRNKKKNIGKGRKRSGRRIISVLLVIALLFFGSLFLWNRYSTVDLDDITSQDWIVEKYLNVDGHSRTALEIKRPKDIVVHYVANPGSTGWANWDYFNSPQSVTSAHFIVGLDGTVIQCIPLNEQSSASNSRNPDTISIECCHPTATGEFSIATYNSLVKLLVWLCEEFNLDADDIIRHYDITGKNCPKYYVEHPDAWLQLKEYVKERL